MNNNYPPTRDQEPADLHSIHHFIWLYHQGELSTEDAAKIEMLIQTDPRAASSSRACLAANAKLSSEEDQARAAHEKAAILRALESSPPVVIISKPAGQRLVRESRETSPFASFFTRLSDWLDFTLNGLSLQAGYSDSSAADEERWFEQTPGDPYRACIVRDASGVWSLRVFTSDAEAAKHRIEVGVRDVPPVLAFDEAEAGLFYAEVEITEEMASALRTRSAVPAFKVL